MSVRAILIAMVGAVVMGPGGRELCSDPIAGAGPVATAPASQPRSLVSYTQKVPGGSDEKFRMIAMQGGRIRVPNPTRPGELHEVVVRDFWMQETELTWDCYWVYGLRRFTRLPPDQRSAGPEPAWSTPSEKPYGDPTAGAGMDGTPVMSITRFAAEEYCRWLSLYTGRKYRLPTEAEWVYACRAGAVDPPAALSVEELGKAAWFGDNAEGLAHPVAQKLPNRWGLYDILGNVAEWCVNPDGTACVRGGSYRSPATEMRAEVRQVQDRTWNMTDPAEPKSRSWLTDGPFVGFRVVCEP